MRKATRCWAISARAVSGSLMSSAGATTMPQPMLSGSQMSMTLPSVGQGSIFRFRIVGQHLCHMLCCGRTLSSKSKLTEDEGHRLEEHGAGGHGRCAGAVVVQQVHHSAVTHLHALLSTSKIVETSSFLQSTAQRCCFQQHNRVQVTCSASPWAALCCQR